jgi:acetyl-CoA acetyltransferase
MREVAVVSFAQTPSVRREAGRTEAEMLVPVVAEAILSSGIPRERIGYTVSGSCDFLSGLPFSFVTALDAIGAWPPISESHVEMDGAWALYEAWVRLQHGDVDAALVYSFGKSSCGDVLDVLALQLDPYYLAPLGLDPVSLAALQARSYLLLSGGSERELAEVAARSRRAALQNPRAQLKGEYSVEELLREPYLVAPLRRHDCPPISDGAAAVVLAAGELARNRCARRAWIRGIDHRIDGQALSTRPLHRSPSAALAAERAGLFRAPVDVAELHAPFTHQELILAEALRLSPRVRVNPSGGALAANPVMVAGLIRIGEAARRVMDGEARRAVAHATSGPCLQQNLVCILSGDGVP